MHWSPVTRSLHFTCAVPSKSEKSNVRTPSPISPISCVSESVGRFFEGVDFLNSRGIVRLNEESFSANRMELTVASSTMDRSDFFIVVGFCAAKLVCD